MTPEQEARIDQENAAYRKLSKEFFDLVREEVKSLGYVTEDFPGAFQFKDTGLCWIFADPVLSGRSYASREDRVFTGEIAVTVRSFYGKSYTWPKRPHPSNVAATLVRHYKKYDAQQRLDEARRARQIVVDNVKTEYREIIARVPIATLPNNVTLTPTPRGIKIEAFVQTDTQLHAILAELQEMS